VTVMPYHVKLSDPSCLLCRDRIAVTEKTIAVLGTGSTYKGCTLSFNFPAHGHSFSYGTVCFDGTEESWRLCRHPPCPTCQKSPIAFVLHIDCVRLLKRCVPKQILLHTWLLGSWSYPWPGAYHDAPVPSLEPLASRMMYADSDLRSLVERVTGLPPELRNLVIDYTANSLLWRFAKVLGQVRFIDYLMKDVKTLLPSTLDCWLRGRPIYEKIEKSLNKNGNERHSLKWFRMGVDDLGIRSIQLLESRSVLPDRVLPDCPWYIVEDIARLDNLKIESNVSSMLCVSNLMLIY
jgi:hypothetical protein